MLQWVVLLVVVAAAVLVLVDSARLGARRGALGGGLLDIGPVSWFVCVLLVWFVALPAYLVARRRLVALGGEGSDAAAAAAPASALAPAASAAAPAPVPAPVPAPAREHGRHRAEPAGRTRRSARAGRSRAENVQTAVVAAPAAAPVASSVAAPVAVPVAAAVDADGVAPAAFGVGSAAASAAEPERLVPPFAAATSWASTADEPSLLEDHSIGAFAPGEPTPGPFAAQPWSTEPFVEAYEPAHEQPAEPTAHDLPAEPEPFVSGPGDSPYLSRFAELCAEGLMSQAELDRVRARLSGTPAS